MLPNDDLARWGEPPTNARELALANLLGEVLERALDQQPFPEDTGVRAEQTGAGHLLEVCRWIDEMIDMVVERSELGKDLSSGSIPAELRVSVRRLVAGRYESVASTQTRPCVVRDLRRVPDDPDRVVLHTGERVRIEVICDRAGYLTVFNVGPQGGLNLLYPTPSDEAKPLRASEPVLIADVELTPPAGPERLYAVWSREPLAMQQLTGLFERGVVLRDMKRVHDTISNWRDEDWHAVLLELEHRG
jgi:hypothetical protein